MSESDGDLSSLLSSSGIIFSGALLNKAISFGASIFMAQLLGDTGYGIVALALTVYFLSNNLLGLGLGQGIGRYYPQAESNDERRSILLTGYTLGIPFSIAGGLGILLLADPIATHLFNKPALTPVIQILAIALPITVAQQLAMGAIRGMRKTVSRTVVKDILEPIVRFGGIILLVLAGYDTIGVAASYLLAAAIGSLVLGYVVVRETDLLDRSISWNWRPKEMLLFSLPLAGSTILWRLMMNTDNILIGAIIPESAAVAHYNVAFVLSQTTLLIYNSLGFIYIPELSELHADQQFDRAKQFYRASTKWFFVFSLPFILVSLLYPEFIITLLYSAEFSSATVPFVILVAGLLVHIGLGQIQQTLTAFGSTRIILVVDVFAVVANLGLNWILIGEYGIVGAATATASTYTLRNLLLFAYLYHSYEFHPVSREYFTVSLIVAAAAVAVFLLPVRPSLLAVVATTVGLTVLTAVSYLRYGVGTADVQLFERLESRFGYSFEWLRELHLSLRSEE